MAIMIGGLLGDQFRGDPNGVAERDLFFGNGGADTGVGRLGSDTLFGGRDADVLLGNEGNDLIDGGLGRDQLDGGDGFDTLSYTQSRNSVFIDLAANVAFGGEAGGDTIMGFENVLGSASNDFLFGGSFANLLVGGAGNDYLFGGTGRDTLIGDVGADTLIGGHGRDTFRYQVIAESTGAPNERDTVADFQVGKDIIDLRGIDAKIISLDLENAFTFIGTAAFSGAGGELRYSTDGTNVLIEGDTTGAGTAGFSLVLQGDHVLSASDFLL